MTVGQFSKVMGAIFLVTTILLLYLGRWGHVPPSIFGVWVCWGQYRIERRRMARKILEELEG